MAATNAADDSPAPGHAAKRDDEEEECDDATEDDDRGFLLCAFHMAKATQHASK
jgi:hypothetical protein